MASRTLLNAGQTKESVYEDLRDGHEARLKKAINNLEAEVIALVSQLKTKGGLLVNDAQNLQTAFDLRTELVKVFDKEYGLGFITPTVSEFDEMAIGVKQYLDTVGLNAIYTEADIGVITALKEGSFINLDVLGKQFQATLADSIYQSTISGLPFSEMVKNIKGSLVGIEDVAGKPMASHAKQIAHDALIGMDRSISAKKAEDLGVTDYLYFGSTVKDSRDFCLRHAGETKPLTEWEQIASSEDWQGKSSSDILNDAGGYNCGHTLLPVPSGE